MKKDITRAAFSKYFPYDFERVYLLKIAQKWVTHYIHTTTSSCAINFFSLYVLFSQGQLDPLSFHKLCIDMQVNKTKFERNGSLEYYHT